MESCNARMHLSGRFLLVGRRAASWSSGEDPRTPTTGVLEASYAAGVIEAASLERRQSSERMKRSSSGETEGGAANRIEGVLRTDEFPPRIPHHDRTRRGYNLRT